MDNPPPPRPPTKKSPRGSPPHRDPSHGERPKWLPVAIGLLGLGLCALIYRWLFKKSCKHYKQSYICSRRTVEALEETWEAFAQQWDVIRCYPVKVPIEDDDH